MNYFVINNMGEKLTGIEKAVINRFKLFKKDQIDSKILTLTWNPTLTKNAKLFGVHNNLFSIYDYFQETQHIEQNTIFNWINKWIYEDKFEIKYIQNTKDVRIFSNGRKVMYVNFYDSDYKYINYINHFDLKGRKIKRDLFDIRGFISCTKYLSKNQKVLHEKFFNTNGQVKIEKYYDTESEKNDLTLLILNNYKKRTYYFNTHNEFVAFFYEELYENGDIYFSDKTANTSPPFLLTNKKIPVVSVLHSTHVKNNDNIEHSDTKNIYKPVFENLERFSAIVVSTEQQKLDLTKRIAGSIPVYNIPVGYKEINHIPKTSIVPKGPLKIISIARYSPEKQLDHQIRLLSKLKNDFDNIELHLFGYGSEQNKLKELVELKNLNEHVKFRGFISNLTEEMASSHLSLITSNMEGFSLAVLESLSNGLPVISYDIAYGPKEMIKNNINGFLVTKNNEEELYKIVKLFLSDIKLQQTFRNNCTRESNQFSNENVLKKWKDLLYRLHTDY
ncbi:glycosyltransferase [Mammaliicoccus sciuri]|uniref:glycosyltransferase n=2 Tax=Mammaliicoccus sciuri TaxID=1296 RepID=UPI00362464D5